MRAGARRLIVAMLSLCFVPASIGPALAHDHRIFYPPQSADPKANPIRSIGPTSPDARIALPAGPLLCTSSAPCVKMQKDVVLTRNPDTPTIYEPGFTTPQNPCVAGECAEFSVDVPTGSGPRTLYARAAWPLQNYYVHIWGIAPDESVIGHANVAQSFDKETGNERAVPLAEFHVADPAPGKWRIQVRAVFGYRIPVDVTIALAPGKPVAYERLGVRELADKYLTQKLTMNVVFAGRKWTSQEIADFRARMPLEYRSGVLQKQSYDCEGDEDHTYPLVGGIDTLLNWGVCHYSGTQSPDAEGVKPYFEPVKYTYEWNFLEADDTWTKDLFQKAEDVTKQDAAFNDSDAANYLAAYHATQGLRNRAADHVVMNPTVSDKIDAFAVEDWIFKSRGNPRYATSFTNLETGKKRDGSFIASDPGAYFDPFYTGKGRKNLEVMPHGTATGLTFFVLDTYSAEYAKDYFRPNAYHHWDVSDHMIDPDSGAEDGPDWARVWGGRYRFFFHDIGAGPNHYEAIDFFVGAVPGSAARPLGDPPIWDYENDPDWQGLLVERTARDVVTMLLYRFTASYLYRPVPADVYFLASNNWSDCYSRPECSPDGITHTILEKIYQPSYVEKNLSAALPGVTFTTERSDPHLKTYRYLGCSSVRAVSNRSKDDLGHQLQDETAGTDSEDEIVLAPNPLCEGASDPIQEILERAKARGDDLAGVGVNDLGASGFVVRKWVEEHRADIAPLRPGQATLTNISVVWPGATTWYLPAIVGGVALPTPNGEIWGILNNTNDRAKGGEATDCAKSQPFSPGCNGIPPARDPGTGFSYTVQHEASHFLGLLHPHDSLTVDKDKDGKWQYYGYSYRHYGDSSMAPTTYAGAFAPYSVLDQDIIQRGHIAEYLRMAEDTLADAHLVDGASGLSTPSATTLKKVAESHRWRDQASALFACGDYLKSERAMRNGFLAAQGVFGPVVKARPLAPGENVLFEIHPQRAFDSHGKAKAGCAGSSSRVLGSRASREKPKLPATGLGDVTMVAGALLLALAALIRRSFRPL